MLLAASAVAASVLVVASARAPAARVVRVEPVAGTPQSATAYVAPDAVRYLTEFPRLLVVRVSGPNPKTLEKRHVRFTCVTPGCVLAPADEPDGVERATPAAYTVEVDKGRASLRVIVSSGRAVGTYIISAVPEVEKGERSVPASFVLTSR